MESRIKGRQFEAGEAKEAAEPKEGPVARAIESKTAQLPSDVFLWGSLASMAVSLAFQLSGKKKTKHLSSFIGQWAPTLLVLGLYNKIVKVAGHDRQSQARARS
jgi:hypothetical protein